MMELKFEVKRHRMSTTQGEAEVIVNGQSIVRYGDNIVLVNGKWDSDKSDNVFIEAAMRQYSQKIIPVLN